jgi:hypothetical protein
MATTYHGIAGVAGWLGVTPELVTRWLIRYGDTPPHDALIIPGRHGDGDKGWLPGRKGDWEEWRASRPGAGAPGRPRPRDPTPPAA